ncbi:hypothetical protein BD770DRAFT_408591 [Pilaira anomala]|nr:hypothetical protein BD770DRAFT_408591 [Pilaira anomala]
MSTFIHPATHSLKFARSFSVSATRFDINKLILVGEVFTDPRIIEFKHSRVAKFTLVTSEVYADKKGSLIRNRQFHDISYWNPQEWFNVVKKGDIVYVEAVVRHGKISDEENASRRTNFNQTLFTLLAPSPNKEENEKKTIKYVRLDTYQKEVFLYFSGHHYVVYK